MYIHGTSGLAVSAAAAAEPNAAPRKPRRLIARRSLIGFRLSPEQFQAHLYRAHGRSQRANLAHTRGIRGDGIGARKTNAVGISEKRRIQRVDRFQPELKLHTFRSTGQGEFEVLEQREVSVLLGGSVEDTNAGAAVVAEVLAARNVAGHAPEGLGIEP